jgi:hypothetical protein
LLSRIVTPAALFAESLGMVFYTIYGKSAISALDITSAECWLPCRKIEGIDGKQRCKQAARQRKRNKN